ncbi:MAG TPA: AAA family ATPase, partial [Polyangiaceae bacterium]|nr:AAA family ATPase [Polyangiaceae bacterium]
MLQPFPLLVLQRNDRVEIVIPFITARSFGGASHSRVCDDAALHLMQCVAEDQQAHLPRYTCSPETFLRRIKLEMTFQDGAEWDGRVAAVLRRWPEEPYLEATLPRLGPKRFAVRETKNLPATVTRYLRDLAGEDSRALRERLTLAVRKKGAQYLDWIEVDIELPDVLPRTVRRSARARIESERNADASKVRRSRAKRRRLTPPSTLSEVGTNLVHQALDGNLPRVIGRDAIADRVCRRIRRRGGAVLLVGPSGAGKTAIIEQVVRQLTTEDSSLLGRRDAWQVDGNRIIAGMSYVGQWEGRCEAMVHELSERGDILVVDDLPSLVFAGRTTHEESHVAGFLDPHLARGELRVLAECTEERLEMCRDEAPSFFSRFHVVRVEPLDEATTLRCLVSRIRALEGAALDQPAERRIRFSPEVPE